MMKEKSISPRSSERSDDNLLKNTIIHEEPQSEAKKPAFVMPPTLPRLSTPEKTQKYLEQNEKIVASKSSKFPDSQIERQNILATDTKLLPELRSKLSTIKMKDRFGKSPDYQDMQKLYGRIID